MTSWPLFRVVRVQIMRMAFGIVSENAIMVFYGAQWRYGNRMKNTPILLYKGKAPAKRALDYGAEDGIRTRNIQLGKLTLYR